MDYFVGAYYLYILALSRGMTISPRSTGQKAIERIAKMFCVSSSATVYKASRENEDDTDTETTHFYHVQKHHVQIHHVHVIGTEGFPGHHLHAANISTHIEIRGRKRTLNADGICSAKIVLLLCLQGYGLSSVSHSLRAAEQTDSSDPRHRNLSKLRSPPPLSTSALAFGEIYPENLAVIT